MRPLSGLCLDLFLLGHLHLAQQREGGGAGFERRVRAHLDKLGLPTAEGFRLFGDHGLSTLFHQIDEQCALREAIVIGEWKAYGGNIPKAELLTFKAASDDDWLARRAADRPVMRLFGGTGVVSEGMRVYAAQWGIVLITPDRWPVPALCDPDPLWTQAGAQPPPPADRRALLSMVRPLGTVLTPLSSGGFRIPPLPAAADLSSRMRLWEHWSDRAWAWWDDAAPARFDMLLTQRLGVAA